MKKLIVLLLILFSAHSFSQSWQWAQKYGANGAENNEPMHMTLDSAGDAYVFGTYGDGTQLNNLDLPWFVSHKAHIYVAKFSKLGDCIWHKEINSQYLNDSPNYMQIKNGKIYLWGTVYFDGYYNTFFLDTTVYGGNLFQQWTHPPISQNFNKAFPWVPNVSYNIFLVMDLNGNILQKKLLCYNQITYASLPARPTLNIDNSGNIYAVGSLITFNNPKNVLFIDTVAVTDSVPFLFESQPILYKFSPQFNLLWYKRIVTAVNGNTYRPDIRIMDVVNDSTGNMYYTGYVSLIDAPLLISPPENVMFDNTHGVHFENSPNGVMFLMKMDTSGTIQWLKQTTNYTPDSANSYASASGHSLALAQDEQKIFVQGIGASKTASNNDCVLFTPTDTLAEPFNYYHFQSDMGFIAAYDLNGNFLWKHVPPANNGSELGAIEYHNHHIYTGLAWGDSLFFQNQWYVVPYLQAQVGYGFATYNTQGNFTDLIRIPFATITSNYNNTHHYKTRLDALGNRWVGGTLNTSLDFGGHIVSDYGVSYLARYNNQCSDTVQNKPTTSIPDTIICMNTNIQLIANPNNVYYQWQNGSHSNVYPINYSTAGTDSLFAVVYNGKCYWTDTIVVHINDCTGVEETKENPLLVYPNPADDIINIGMPQYCKDAQLTLLNATGQIQFSTSFNSKAYTLDVSHYAPGMYVVLLKTPERIYSRKVSVK